MKATVNKETCIGCGLCVADCPAVFAMTEDNLATVIVEPVPAEQKDACKTAAGNCPVEAISITD
jgi:ferredoxin